MNIQTQEESEKSFVVTMLAFDFKITSQILISISGD